jgi:hypothetical protein
MDKNAAAVAASQMTAHINGKVRERLLNLARRQGATNRGDASQLVEAWIAEIAVLIDPESTYHVLTAPLVPSAA